MIVRNEENTIRRALSWGKGVVSERIVVDTGSTDRTVELAREMGATVYHFDWVDDFAAAKNFAIEKARHEWIAFLDADEYFTEDGARLLLHAITQLHPLGMESILTAWVNLENDGSVSTVGTQRRVFRNLPTLRYQGRIHEAINTLDGHRIPTVDMVRELSIFHTGYGAAESAKKSGRNLKLIQMELADHPDSYEMWGYMGQEYVSQKEWGRAEEAFREAIALMPEGTRGIYDATTSVTHLRLLEVLAVRPGATEAALMEAYQQAIGGWPEEADYDYTVGTYLASIGKWEKAEWHMRRSLGILERYGTTGKSMVTAGNIRKAYELLAICCHNSGQLGECVRLATALLKEDPYLLSTLTVTLRAFSEDPQSATEAGARELVGFLGKSLYDLGALRDRIFVLRAAMAAGYGALIVVMRETFTAEELTAVDNALGRG